MQQTRIRDYDPDALKLRLFPFSLRGKAKEWLLALPRGSITSWADCCSKFLSKFCPPAKIMQLRSQITGFKQEEREPLALAWDRMKEAIRNYPNHGMEEWLILHMFYNGLNHMSKTMLDTAAGGTIMGKPIEDVKKLLDDMQENHAQWHVERTTTKKVNVIEENSSELTTKLEELISLMKGKEEVNVNAITNEETSDVNFIARNSYNPNWKNNSYAPKLPYPNNGGASNNFNGANGSNRNTLEETLKSFIASQTEQNENFKNILKNHDNLLGQLTSKVVGLTKDVQILEARSKNMEAQVAKIAESQTLILAKFVGKSEPNPIEEVKMVSNNEEKAEVLDTSHVPEYNYTIADFVKMISMKYPLPEVTNDEAYNVFVEQVAAKVRELDDERKKLYSKLPAKQEDAFEPTIEVEIRLNKFSVLCDLGASVSTIPKS